ncbi:UDP-N-acetylmuramoylalanine--D-glutamate ligase [Dermatophilus congolensis]|uniref:UDP-N-acetylmuramoylalanine--D-glutamate ligase n=2 Tax=Dermatophilus congolensis TaxID=1863 RepID=A0AA46GZW1_9MICO|nr:UDP-N-acetylmuramoylalanine--D-glutamate ligase [Dermatophilus congolensis]
MSVTEGMSGSSIEKTVQACESGGFVTTSVVGLDPRPGLTHRDANWAGLRVLVAGLGVSGFAAADALLERGARVTVVDGAQAPAESVLAEKAKILQILGAVTLLGQEGQAAIGAPETVSEIDLVVTSPGWRPDNSLLVRAAQAGVPIWGEVELAWRMRPAENPAPWLCVTGTNGKTTAVTMVASILSAAGLRSVAAGNVGTPLLEAVLHPDPYQVIAVELSSFQLHWQRSISPAASVCLNVAPDHVDWHGSMEAYAADKGRIYENTQIACIYNGADPVTEQLVRDADVIEGCRAVGFTLGMPGLSMLGVVEDVLADRAFVEDRANSAAEIGTLTDLSRGSLPPAPHFVANALAAAALTRAIGVPASVVQAGLRKYEVEKHRIAEVAVVDGVTFIDDSKATNPHAAAASLGSFASVVWVAGGLLKGADVDELVRTRADRLRGVVLLGRDRAILADALERYAPCVPVIDVGDEAAPESSELIMERIVREASALAQQGDVVLLAPAAASMDMFLNYGARGDAFAEAVRRFAGDTCAGESE